MARHLTFSIEQRALVCELCGSHDDIEVHHKDGDFRNQVTANRQVLCRPCHQQADQSRRIAARAQQAAVVPSPTNGEPLTADQFRAALGALVGAAGSQSRLAIRLGVTPGYLSQIVTGHRPPSERVLTALGYRRVEAYERL
jgi:hypothetical protein